MCLFIVLVCVAAGRTGKWLIVLVSVVDRAGNVVVDRAGKMLLFIVLASIAVGCTGKRLILLVSIVDRAGNVVVHRARKGRC